MAFNTLKFARAFIKIKAGRAIDDFLAPWGEDRLLYLILNKKYITDYIPADYKERLKSMMAQYRDSLDDFKNEEVYLWIPQKYRVFFESVPGGKEWAIREIQHIREYLMA